MIDHVGLEVADLDASKSFYEQALAPLGYAKLMEYPEAVGFGREGKPDFWIGKRGTPAGSTHVAILSPDRASVDAFHAAALAAGGEDNGAPGPREYHENYYGAYVLDPDGNNLEAVCHHPE